MYKYKINNVDDRFSDEINLVVELLKFYNISYLSKNGFLYFYKTDDKDNLRDVSFILMFNNVQLKETLRRLVWK